MRRSSTLVIISVLSTTAVASLSHAASAQAGAPASFSTPQIITSATGEAEVVPDRAAVYVGAQSRAATAAAAARDNAQRQRAIIDAILALGVPRAQITTENYTVTPDTRFEPATQKTTVSGYIVSNVVRVELQHIDQVGAVLDAALAKGANQINSLDFFSSNSDSARHEALGQAVARARADAEALARAAGGSLGQLLEITTLDNSPRPVFRALSAAQSAPTPIEPGQQRIQATVTARWIYLASR
jgi:hypothetical protein